MSMDVGGSKGSLKADINVTPLVDVMLVLLIIMMLIAPMLQKGVPVNLPLGEQRDPEAGHTGPDGCRRSTRRTSSGSTGCRYSKDDFASRVQTVLEDKKDKIVLIKADTDARYSAIMEAMDGLRKANIEDIALITDPKNPPAGSTGGK